MSINGPLLAGTAALLLWLEYRLPLRRAVESKPQRLARNLTIAGASAAVVRMAELPIVLPLADLVEHRGYGLLNAVGLPAWASIALAVVLMDYTLYVWHVLTHRVSWLWRVHLVHHIDRDLDASTALRFHFVEILLSVPWRAAQVLVIGVSPLAFGIWQAALMISILFHHSNIRLPYALERRLAYVIVTPRMHGIHHSIVREETDSNWSSGLTLWDRLHGTLRLNVPQDEVVIGVPAYRAADEVSLPRILSLPFRRQPASWRLPDGTQPVRERVLAPADALLP